MKFKVFSMTLALLSFVTGSYGAETVNWPKWDTRNVSAIDKFVEFYKDDLSKVSAVLNLSNSTGQTLQVGPITIAQGQSTPNIPIELSQFGPLTKGANFQVTNVGGTYLGTFAINIQSRGYIISRHPDAYNNPKDVFERASVTFLIGKNKPSNFTSKEFDLYTLKRAVLYINLNLKGASLEESTLQANVESE